MLNACLMQFHLGGNEFCNGGYTPLNNINGLATRSAQPTHTSVSVLPMKTNK